MDADRFERVQVSAASELWDWLEAHHADEKSIWLVTWKAAHRERYVSRDEVLDALVAFGWIDGRRMKLDSDRTMQLISPRKQQVWAESYKRRAKRLEAEGRMQGPGRAKIVEAQKSGLWDALADVDALEVPDDLLAALERTDGLGWWEKAAPSYRRNVLRWIATAKREETRLKRIDEVATRAARGEKVPQY